MAKWRGKGISGSMNHYLWDIDVVTASLPKLKRDGFSARLESKDGKLSSGEDALEYIIIVEWK